MADKQAGKHYVRTVLRGYARSGLRSTHRQPSAGRPPRPLTPFERGWSAPAAEEASTHAQQSQEAKEPTPPQAQPHKKTTMTLKGDDKQHDAYRKKKAAQYKEPRALTEDELAEAQAREIAEKRAAKAHVPLAAINRGDFGEGVRRPRRKF